MNKGNTADAASLGILVRQKPRGGIFVPGIAFVAARFNFLETIV